MGALVALMLAGCFGGGDSNDPADPRSTKTAAETSLPLADLNPAKASDVSDGGTLRIGIASFPATFNPVHTAGVSSTAPQILAPTLGRAVRVGEDGSWAVDPNYATDVTITSRKPLTVRVKLNRRAVWQGGTSITSADMVSFVAAMQDDDYAAATPPVLDLVDTVRPRGKFAYDVVFDKPTADWPAAVYPALPKAYTKSVTTFNEGLTATAPSSNGPFLVSSIERRTGTITLERNPRWWGDRPKLESIVWRIGAEDVLAAAHVAGELEAAPVTPDNRAVLADADADLRSSRGSEWSHLTINGGAGPLADADVRRAVMLAVDAKDIVRDTSKRYGVNASAMDSVVLLPGQVGHRVSGARDRNLYGARALLTRAGWKRSGQDNLLRREGKALTLSLPVPDSRTGAAARAESIAQNLADVGIRVKVKKVPAASFFDRYVIPLKFDLTTFTWAGEPFDLGDSKRLFTPIDSPMNFTGKTSKATGAAFDAAITELGDTARQRAILQLDRTARRQASVMPLAVIPEVLAVDPKVRNYGPASLQDLDWTVVGFAAGKGD